SQLRDKNVAEMVIREDAIIGKLRKPQSQGQNLNFEVELLPGQNFDRKALADEVLRLSPKTKVDFNNSNSYLINILVNFIPWLLVFAFIWFFVFRQLRGVGGGPGGMLGNFGRS